MLRRTVVAVPVLAAIAALVGVWLAAAPVVAAVVAAVAGLAVAGALAAAAERRTRGVTQRVLRFADGDTASQIRPAGSAEWRRLVRAVNSLGASVQERFDDLAGERARVERLLDNLPTALLLFTREGLAYANPSAQRLFRIARHLARTPLQVLGSEGLVGAVVEARETGRTIEVEVQRAGRMLAARASVTAPDEVALVVSDLTEARRLEAIRRDFVTNASHELKTPVAGMQALADSLAVAVDRDPDRARVMIQRLQREAARLSVLVRDLLDLARVEEAEAQRARGPVDLTALARAEAERLAPLAADMQVRVTVEGDPHAVVVSAPEDLRLVVANLLDNAVQYNRPEGSVRVVVHRREAEVELEVADTGIGIPAAELDRVFERFYRVDKARSRAAGGTGLGLSLVRHTVGRHGGDVSVHSVLGEGSTFRVRLPVEGRH